MSSKAFVENMESLIQYRRDSAVAFARNGGETAIRLRSSRLEGSATESPIRIFCKAVAKCG
jgi:hypothetical protein